MLTVAIYAVENFEDKEIGRFIYNGKGLSMDPPDSEALRNLAEIPVYNDEAKKVVTSKDNPKAWMIGLHARYKSAYLRAGKVQETGNQVKPSPFARSKSLSYQVKSDDTEYTEGQWVTVGGTSCDAPKTGSHCGGTPMQISRGGVVKKGPAALKGKKVDELTDDKGKGVEKPRGEIPKPPKVDKSNLTKIEPTGKIKDRLGREYVIKYTPENRTFSISVPGKEDLLDRGVTAGGATLKRNMQSISSVGVNPEFRRRGLATALYNYIENQLGYKLAPNWALTPEGETFWAARQNTNKPPLVKPSPFSTKPDIEAVTDKAVADSEETAKPKASEPPKDLFKSLKKPKNIELDGVGKTPKELKTQIKAFFGTELDDSTIGALACVPDNTIVIVERAGVTLQSGKLQGGYLKLNVSNSDFQITRKIERDSRGDLVCYNKLFVINNGSKYKGQGAALFANQVKSLQEAGVKKIVTAAAGAGPKARPSNMNGYYTWPRLGYEGKIQDIEFEQFPPEIQKSMGDSRDIQDLMATPEGRQVWKDYGEGFDRMEFDLTPGSRSLKVLEAYLKEREEKKGGPGKD